jgi:hypothetical protein
MPDACWHIDTAACLAWLVVSEIHTNTVHSAVKYNVQKEM